MTSTKTLCSEAANAAVTTFIEVKKQKTNRGGKKKERKETQQSGHQTAEQHDQNQTKRWLSLTFFSSCFHNQPASTLTLIHIHALTHTQNIDTHSLMSGKQQFCSGLEKSPIYIHSCLTERQKIPMESKIAGLVV